MRIDKDGVGLAYVEWHVATCDLPSVNGCKPECGRYYPVAHVRAEYERGKAEGRREAVEIVKERIRVVLNPARPKEMVDKDSCRAAELLTMIATFGQDK